MFGITPVATPTLMNVWYAIRQPIPAAISMPFVSFAFLATWIHCNTINSRIAIIITLTTKPSSSPMTEKMKSVCCSEMKFASFTVAMVEVFKPFPVSCPEPELPHSPHRRLTLRKLRSH